MGGWGLSFAGVIIDDFTCAPSRCIALLFHFTSEKCDEQNNNKLVREKRIVYLRFVTISDEKFLKNILH